MTQTEMNEIRNYINSKAKQIEKCGTALLNYYEYKERYVGTQSAQKFAINMKHLGAEVIKMDGRNYYRVSKKHIG